jgi:hypothetical protein
LQVSRTLPVRHTKHPPSNRGRLGGNSKQGARQCKVSLKLRNRGRETGPPSTATNLKETLQASRGASAPAVTDVSSRARPAGSAERPGTRARNGRLELGTSREATGLEPEWSVSARAHPRTLPGPAEGRHPGALRPLSIFPRGPDGSRPGPTSLSVSVENLASDSGGRDGSPTGPGIGPAATDDRRRPGPGIARPRGRRRGLGRGERRRRPCR